MWRSRRVLTGPGHSCVLGTATTPVSRALHTCNMRVDVLVACFHTAAHPCRVDIHSSHPCSSDRLGTNCRRPSCHTLPYTCRTVCRGGLPGARPGQGGAAAHLQHRHAAAAAVGAHGRTHGGRRRAGLHRHVTRGMHVARGTQGVVWPTWRDTLGTHVWVSRGLELAVLYRVRRQGNTHGDAGSCRGGSGATLAACVHKTA